MIILEDTRQQEKKHETKHSFFRQKGIQWNRTALYCGDYTLPANQRVCIDTKKDIAELIGDIQVKTMNKKDVKQAVYDICAENHISFELSDRIYHAICDDDMDRFAEKDINHICFESGISESMISEFQKLYVKRHGFFHRGLKRAQNSGIKLYVLVENSDGVKSLEDLFKWINPRLNIWINSKTAIGLYKNGQVKYKKVQKYPSAMSGEKLAKACITMHEKYGVEFRFCTPEESGAMILKLLGNEV